MTRSFFFRHTPAVLVRREDMERLWEEDRVAIHFPGDTANNARDSESLDLDHYTKRDEKVGFLSRGPSTRRSSVRRSSIDTLD